jgi:hypothetical protein
MDNGQLTYIVLKLVLGAAAAFLAIIIWAKTMDTVWVLMVLGSISSYIETVYSILGLFGITEGIMVHLGTMPFLSIVLASLPELFFISAFLLMIVRRRLL